MAIVAHLSLLVKKLHQLRVAQAIYAAKEEGKQVAVVADDTEVYIMLLYHYHAESLTIPMKLHSTQTGRACIDVTATVHMLKDTILSKACLLFMCI